MVSCGRGWNELSEEVELSGKGLQTRDRFAIRKIL